MNAENELPEDETIEDQETAVPLPERDAMSLINIPVGPTGLFADNPSPADPAPGPVDPTQSG